MSSFLDIRLAPQISGYPKTLCETELWRAHQVACDLIVAVRDPSVEMLAWATLGFQPLLAAQSLTKVTLAMLLSDEDGFEQKGGPTVSPPDRGSIDFRRLQLLRFLKDRGRLAVVCRKIVPETDSNLRLGGFSRMSLLSDRVGNIVTIGWRNGLKNAATAEIAGELAWSYGDPLKRAIRAWTHFDGLRERGADQVESNWESAVNDFIANIPPPDEPVEELFYAEDDGAMSVKLFQHQREAVNAWFDNGLHGIFEMCTGAGKTITSLACVWRLVSEFAREGRDLPLVLV